MQKVSSSQAKRTVKLIMVTDANNNKFYHMHDNADGTFSVEYGRVGSSVATAQYHINLWETKYREKVRKGYKDVTYLFAETSHETPFQSCGSLVVDRLMQRLLLYAQKSILANYMVTADQVSARQIEEAQALLNLILETFRATTNYQALNQHLLALYALIPRRMNNVRDHLLNGHTQPEYIAKLIAHEQATLDVMAGQVSLKQASQTPEKERPNLLENLGISVNPVEDVALLQYIQSLMQEHAPKFVRAYEVTHHTHQNRFDTQLSTATHDRCHLLWHGSRNENWLSILGSGLVLRPTNAIITGKMFGYGLYFADRFAKSLNYSSLSGAYWTGGNAGQGFLALYQVHTGRPLHIKKHEAWCYQLDAQALKKRGLLKLQSYDSVFAEKGADLINNEYIVYQESQCTIKYLVEIGRS